MWEFRRCLWNFLAIRKYKTNKPREFPVPTGDTQHLETKPLVEWLWGINLPNIRVATTIPPDEAIQLNLRLCTFLALINRVFCQNQAHLPPIDASPEQELTRAYTPRHRRCFAAPIRPEEYTGTVDLGFLAVAGPYFCFLEQGPGDAFQWDLRHLDHYQVQEGLRRLGVRVLFAVDEPRRRLRATQIDSELGTRRPGDADWDLAQQLALCAATTFLSCIKHYNNIHLANVAQFAVASRNNLPHDHPLLRLIWPHLWGTEYSNELVTKALLMKNGDFEGVFSFTHTGLTNLFQDWYDRYDIRVMDPQVDAEHRGVLNAGFDLPALDNRLAHLEVMARHTCRYLHVYYCDDDALRANAPTAAWIAELEHRVPGGVRRLLGDQLTIEGLARFLAAFIYMGTVEHQILGSAMWNYQLFTDIQPVRVYRNGQRVPVDVYQRLVNYNFLLNVSREPLRHDFSRIALDPRGADCFRQFENDLRALQDRLELGQPAYWKMCPNILESSVNG